MIFGKLRATEQATGNAQIRATFFVGRDRLMMQNAGDLHLTFIEYQEFAVGLLWAAYMSEGRLRFELDGWGADKLYLEFLEGRASSMNMREALDADLGPTQGSLAVLDQSGDTKIIWDRTRPEEIEIARAAFDKAKANKFMAYKVEGKEGKKGEVITEFDPQAERIILAPPMQGG